MCRNLLVNKFWFFKDWIGSPPIVNHLSNDLVVKVFETANEEECHWMESANRIGFVTNLSKDRNENFFYDENYFNRGMPVEGSRTKFKLNLRWTNRKTKLRWRKVQKLNNKSEKIKQLWLKCRNDLHKMFRIPTQMKCVFQKRWNFLPAMQIEWYFVCVN
jgi:hypothetical protein